MNPSQPTDIPADQERASPEVSLVEAIRKNSPGLSDRVAAAFAGTPRAVFLPEGAFDVDKDVSIRTKQGESGTLISTSTQPSLMATLLEALDLQPGDAVLEIGTGTGYNASIISRLVGPRGRVTTIEIDSELAGMAAEKLREIGADNVEVVAGDGWRGWSRNAPYDRIIATAQSNDVSADWMEQLRVGGVLVVPVTFDPGGLPLIVSFDRVADGLTSRRLIAGHFIEMRGAHSPGDIAEAAPVSVSFGNVRVGFRGPAAALNGLPTEFVEPLERAYVADQPDSVDLPVFLAYLLFTRPETAATALVSEEEDGEPGHVRAFVCVLVGSGFNASGVLISLADPLASSFGFGAESAVAMAIFRDSFDEWILLGSPRVSELRLDLSVSRMKRNALAEKQSKLGSLVVSVGRATT